MTADAHGGATTAVPGEVQPRLPGERPLVLVARSDLRRTRHTTAILQDEFDVIQAGDGAEALDLVIRDHPDVVICDMTLPVVDGRAVMREIGVDRDLSDIPVIMIGEPGTPTTEALSAGAQDFLLTSHTPEELKARVTAAVRGHKAIVRFRSLFEQVPIGIARWDGQGRLLEANPALLEALGSASRTELAGLEFGDIIVGQDPEHLVAQVLAGAVDAFDCALRHKDGRTVEARVRTRLVRDREGQVRFIDATVEDITETAVAAAALELEEARYRSVFDVSPVALWEEDFSAVAEWMEGLRSGGITDFRAYVAENPEEGDRGIEMIRVLRVNHAAVALIGGSGPEDLLGTIPAAVLTADAKASLIEQMTAIWEGSSRVQLELEGSTFGGQLIDCMLNWAAPTVDAAPDYSRVVVAITDITERKAAEREILRHNTQLATLYEISKKATSSLDLINTLQTIADEAAILADSDSSLIVLVDTEREEVAHVCGSGLDLAALGPIAWEQFLLGLNGWAFAERRATWSDDIAQDPRGAPGALGQAPGDDYGAVAIAPLVAEDTVIGTLAALNHRTGRTFAATDLAWVEMLASQAALTIRNAQLYEESRRSNDRLRRTHEELRHTQGELLQAQRLRSIGELAAGIAHEINTPIQYIGDNTQFLAGASGDLLALGEAATALCRATREDGDIAAAADAFELAAKEAEIDFLAEEIPVAVEQAMDGVDRVAGIVRALKDFAHPGATEKAPIDINRAVVNTLTVTRNEHKYAAEIVTDLDPDLPPVPALSGPLNQALLNVVVNAAHAVAEATGDGAVGKGTITISTSANADWVEIRVADTGGGIPEEARPHVFDPFFTTKQVGKGSGQGLAIARSVVVDKHGGEISFETEMGAGTTFVIRLPRSSKEAAE